MAVDEQRRLRLYEAVRNVLGDDDAATLMEYLPPVGWGDVATKHDIVALKDDIASVRQDLVVLGDTLRAEFRGEIAEVRGEIGGLRGELRGEIGSLEARVYEALREQTTRLVTWMIPTWLSAVGIAVAVSQLG